MVTAMSFSRARFAIRFEMVFMWRATNRRNALCQSFVYHQWIHKISVLCKVQTKYFFIIKTKLSVILVMTLYIWWSEHWYGSLHYHWFFYHVDNKHRHCISLCKMVDDNNNEIQISVWSCQKAGVPQKAFCVYFCQLLFC